MDTSWSRNYAAEEIIIEQNWRLIIYVHKFFLQTAIREVEFKWLDVDIDVIEWSQKYF